MRTTRRQGSLPLGVPVVKTAALVVSLLVSAYLLAVANAYPTCAWLDWFSLVPLFLVIRFCRPTGAMLGGALWGVALYVFSVAQPGAAVAGGMGSLLLLALIPAAYAGGGAWLTRRIGFSPFVLGYTWMRVELALEPGGQCTGRLGQAGGGGTFLHWVGQTLGRVLVAFLVALVNASLVSVLSVPLLRIPQSRHRIPSSHYGASRCPQPLFCFPRFAIRPSQPRAPPSALA